MEIDKNLVVGQFERYGLAGMDFNPSIRPLRDGSLQTGPLPKTFVIGKYK
jgi:hypothetical protein